MLTEKANIIDNIAIVIEISIIDAKDAMCALHPIVIDFS